MRKNINTINIQGYVYQSNLEEKTVANETSANYGKPYITGSIDVAIDENCMNVINVHYTYITETTKSGNKNLTYGALKKIMTGKTVMTDGVENALKVKCSPSIALNDFYPQGSDELVSTVRNEGGFVTIISQFDADEKSRNKFIVDMVINKVNHVEADPEKNIAEDFVRLQGAIFNFRNDILPFTAIVRNPAAIEYFEGLDITGANPVYTQIWGPILNSSVTVTHTTESAFGEDAVDVTTRKVREYVVTGAKKIPYEYNDPETITEDEIKEAIQNRNVMLADIKKRQEDYNNTKNNAISSMPVNTAPELPAGGFSF